VTYALLVGIILGQMERVLVSVARDPSVGVGAFQLPTFFSRLSLCSTG
jgi:hypothetical protein